MRTTLWVTTAAAALIAGTTFAGAQTGKTNEGGASSGSGQMNQSQGSTQKGAASEQKGAKPGMAQGKEERTEQKGAKPGMAQGKEERTEKKGLEGKEQRSTQAGEKAKGPKGAEKGKPGMAQEKGGEKGGAQTGQSTTGQQKPSTQTQQGTTSGGSVQLSQEQKTKVHEIVVKESSARVENVDFSLSVGTVVPRHIKLVMLPAELVEIVPQYRSYRFIIVRDEILIIDPNTFRIVAIIPV